MNNGNIHRVRKVIVEETCKLPNTFTRTIRIIAENGREFELVLFADDVEHLTIHCV